MRKGRFAWLSDGGAAEAGDARRLIRPAALAAGAPAAVAAAAALAQQPLTIALTACAGAALGGLAVSLAGRTAAPGRTGAEEDSGLVAAFEESACGWFWRTNADGLLSYVSETLAKALGRDRESLIGRRFEELLLVEERADVQRPTLGFHLSARFPFADAIVSPNGRKELCWSLSGRPDFDEVGRFLGFRGIALSVSDRQRADVQSSRLAASDSLTGLPNRARMRAMLDEALANSARRLEGCGLMLIDLDRFKQVNDTLGHPIGDLLLKEVAQRLAAVIGGEGQIGRLGGDEFEAVLPGIDEEGRLAALAERLIGSVSAPYVIRGHTVAVGASVGIAISRPAKTYADALIKEADLALYAAKNAGRGTFRFFEPEMHAQASERQILENDLRSAVGKGQMRLVFQPIVSAATEDLTGFEALVRWAHPVRGTLAPADFLPIAEASGLIGGIGEWILRTACAEAAKWPRHLRVAVNVSAVQIEQPGLAAVIAGALAAADLDPGRLELEIGESALAADTAEAASALASLKALGVGLALDDFGTGLSSVRSLKRVQLDRLKIDPALLRAALPDGSRAQAVLAAVVGLAERLDMAVTAEGAETLEELTLVRAMGCGEVQGFLFGRPMAAGEAAALAAQSRPVSAREAARDRPPRHSLIRRGALRWEGESLPVRLRNVSAAGAMIECGRHFEPGEPVELDLDGGVRVGGEVRWSQEGRVGLKFAEAFDLRRLGRAPRRDGPPPLLRPDYLKSENSPDSPWAARSAKLTIRDVRGR